MINKRCFSKRILGLVLCFMFLCNFTFVAFAAETSSEVSTEEAGNYRMTNIEVGNPVYEGDLTYRPIEFDIVPADTVSESEPEKVTVPLTVTRGSSDERTYLVFNSVQNSIQYYRSSSDRYFGFTISANKNDGTAVDNLITVRLYNDLSSTAIFSRTIRANGSIFSNEIAVNTSSKYHQFKFTPASNSTILCHVWVNAYYR